MTIIDFRQFPQIIPSVDPEALMRPVILLALLALAACRAEGTSQPQGQAAEPPKPVQVAEVQLAPAIVSRAWTGVVRARREADIGFRTGGRITERLCQRRRNIGAFGGVKLGRPAA
jgi:multidrug efflux pump subunit AcrA (membrane-fusion protein)